MGKNTIIIVLLCLLAVVTVVHFSTCGKKNAGSEVTVTVIDTQFVPSPPVTIHDTPAQVSSTPKPSPVAPQPSKNNDSLLQQFKMLSIAYNEVSKKYYALNTFLDTLHIDSSKIVITDNIEQNKNTGRTATFFMKYPVITKQTTTTTIPGVKRQLFIGAGLQMPTTLNGMLVGGGFLFKNKRDNIIGFDVATDPTKLFNSGPKEYYFGLRSYWKLHVGK